jgi:hypothetical protein
MVSLARFRAHVVNVLLVLTCASARNQIGLCHFHKTSAGLFTLVGWICKPNSTPRVRMEEYHHGILIPRHVQIPARQ